MIYLKEIYCEPKGLFEKVTFHNGVNVIYGQFTEEASDTDTLNSIGKSTLVELIDFALLGAFDKRKKLYKAKDIMLGYTIVLEFEACDKNFKIKRSINNPDDILIESIGDSKIYQLNQAKEKMFDICFGKKDYVGIINKKDYRTLINFYIRNEKDGFNDVIKYFKGKSEVNFIPYHLFLLNINNELSTENMLIINNINDISKTKNQIKDIIEKQYSISDISMASAELSNKKYALEKANQMIKEFKLEETYEALESEIELLTNKIKKLERNRYNLKKRKATYESNLEFGSSINVNQISKIYKELDELFSIEVKITLEDAIEFRRKLAESRKEYLLPEIQRLEERIDKCTETLKKLDDKRGELYKVIKAKGGLKDLTESIGKTNDLNKEISEMEGQIKLYNDVDAQLLKLKGDLNDVCIQMTELISGYNNYIEELRRMYSNIYVKIYNDTRKAMFDISVTPKKHSKLSILTMSLDANGWGKGRACILIYDLLVFLIGIKKELCRPRFLIHDGVFYGVDANQFINTLNYLDTLSKTEKFQYIITAKESDIWISESLKKYHSKFKFNFNEKVVARYTEKNKIFGRDF